METLKASPALPSKLPTEETSGPEPENPLPASEENQTQPKENDGTEETSHEEKSQANGDLEEESRSSEGDGSAFLSPSSCDREEEVPRSSGRDVSACKLSEERIPTRGGFLGWFRSAENLVHKGRQAFEAVAPDMEEFVKTITSDTKEWVHQNYPSQSSPSAKLVSPSAGENGPSLSAVTTSSGASPGEGNAVDAVTSSTEKVASLLKHYLSEGIDQAKKTLTKIESFTGLESDEETGWEATRSGERKKTEERVERQPSHSRHKGNCPSPSDLEGASLHFRPKYESLCSSRETYTEDPASRGEESFEKFEVDEYDVLEWLNEPTVGRMKEQIVPETTSEEMFWKRFLYRLRELHKDEQRLCSILSRAEAEDPHEEELVSWTCEDGGAEEKREEEEKEKEQPTADVSRAVEEQAENAWEEGEATPPADGDPERDGSKTEVSPM